VAEVIGIEYDPNRSARIALIKYADGELSYILAPNGLKIGATVVAGNDVPSDFGEFAALRAIPMGTNVQTLNWLGRGGQVAAQCRATGHAYCTGKPDMRCENASGEIRRIHENCFATIGQVGNVDHMNVFERKAGRTAWRGDDACARHGDEPHRSPHGWRPGEIKRSGGRHHPVSPWGQLQGFKTAAKHKAQRTVSFWTETSKEKG